jgi:hypothetical protein
MNRKEVDGADFVSIQINYAIIISIRMICGIILFVAGGRSSRSVFFRNRIAFQSCLRTSPPALNGNGHAVAIKKGRDFSRPRFNPLTEIYEQPLVEPQVSHFKHVPLRTMVKLPHSPQLSPS